MNGEIFSKGNLRRSINGDHKNLSVQGSIKSEVNPIKERENPSLLSKVGTDCMIIIDIRVWVI